MEVPEESFSLHRLVSTQISGILGASGTRKEEEKMSQPIESKESKRLLFIDQANL